MHRGKPLIVELHPGYVVLRAKGTRERISVDYQAVYDLGCKLEARARQVNEPPRKR